MSTKLTIDRVTEELQSKLGILSHASQILKEEFIGINKIIDEVISSIQSWYLLPELQRRPLVINLWGMTGTGKTSLVNRLVELLEKENNTYHADFSSNEDPLNEFSSMMKEVVKVHPEANNILVFDEFQFAKIIDSKGLEKDNKFKELWHFLDTGVFRDYDMSYEFANVYEEYLRVQKMLRAGVEGEEGTIVKIPKKIQDENSRKASNFDSTQMEVGEPIIRDRNWDDIVDYSSFASENDLADYLCTLNMQETLKFLNQIVTIGPKPKDFNLSNSLIFVLGNLDEAYTMSKDLNADVDADVFHEASLKIGLPEIKKALGERFRKEQISRLGNNHIIYPAFSKASYQKLIDLEVGKTLEGLRGQIQIPIDVTDELKELIYEEGVYPTQGVRPLFSTIYQVIGAFTSIIAVEYFTKVPEAERVLLDVQDGILQLIYLDKGEIKHQYPVQLNLKIHEKKMPKPSDLSAIVAVHEAGHALVMMMLSQVIPKQVCVVSSDSDKAGFVISGELHEFKTRQEVTQDVAIGCGGLLAEQLIFGKDNSTLGAESDVTKVTQLVLNALKVAGQGESMFKSGYELNDDEVTNMALKDLDDRVEIQAREWLNKGRALAEGILKDNQSTLTRLAKHLMEKGKVNSAELIEFMRVEMPDAEWVRVEDVSKKGYHLERLMG